VESAVTTQRLLESSANEAFSILPVSVEEVASLAAIALLLSAITLPVSLSPRRWL
jgi:hypothetical protein